MNFASSQKNNGFTFKRIELYFIFNRRINSLLIIEQLLSRFMYLAADDCTPSLMLGSWQRQTAWLARYKLWSLAYNHGSNLLHLSSSIVLGELIHFMQVKRYHFITALNCQPHPYCEQEIESSYQWLLQNDHLTLTISRLHLNINICPYNHLCDHI